MRNNYVMTTVAFAALTVASACSTSSRDSKSTKSLEGHPPRLDMVTQYTTITFEPGESELTKMNKALIKELLMGAHKKKNQIEQIRILSWSDMEYPMTQENKTTSKDILLAGERAEKIRNYIKNDLKETDDIDSYNMARKPSFLSQLFRSDEAMVKETFEVSGTTSSRLADGSLSYTKASKALVIINYKGDEDK